MPPVHIMRIAVRLVFSTNTIIEPGFDTTTTEIINHDSDFRTDMDSDSEVLAESQDLFSTHKIL